MTCHKWSATGKHLVINYNVLPLLFKRPKFPEFLQLRPGPQRKFFVIVQAGHFYEPNALLICHPTVFKHNGKNMSTPFRTSRQEPPVECIAVSRVSAVDHTRTEPYDARLPAVRASWIVGSHSRDRAPWSRAAAEPGRCLVAASARSHWAHAAVPVWTSTAALRRTPAAWPRSPGLLPSAADPHSDAPTTSSCVQPDSDSPANPECDVREDGSAEWRPTVQFTCNVLLTTGSYDSDQHFWCTVQVTAYSEQLLLRMHYY